ncbi:MAG: UDP-2,3-diacylglucosamine diphosphatase LpxI [Alphaproteobacteria bacterium]|nr:UDP-2,3-diacylglucosamine diphosphatase LpxI [Alphaproteobacteria bacterium]USO07768.1 MAG: UDP-2,3-diacylglucosamine diphosphatase LpxI [Rhodospirillales bacterium]
MTDTAPAPRKAALCVVAGGGTLPATIARHVVANGGEVFVARLRGHADDPVLEGFSHIDVRPGQMGRVFSVLRARGIRDLVLIGRMTRPRWWQIYPDFTTLRLLPRLIGPLLRGGDDALLRALRRVLEDQGFRLVAAQDLMAELLAPSGVLGRHAPDARAMADIALGMQAARALGVADAGQGVVVADGYVIAREDARGTDAMITAHPQAGAVLVKAAKPQQDRALDLPGIGPATVRAAWDAGYAGIAIEAGGTLIAERAETIALADDARLFLIGVQ